MQISSSLIIVKALANQTETSFNTFKNNTESYLTTVSNAYIFTNKTNSAQRSVFVRFVGKM